MKHITRRQAFRWSTLYGLTWSSFGCGASDRSDVSDGTTANTFRFIDTHVHYFEPNANGGATSPPAQSTLGRRFSGRGNLPEDVLQLAAPYKLAGSIFLEYTFSLAGNDWMVEVYKSSELCNGVVMAMLPNDSGFQMQNAADILFELATTYPTIRCFISHMGIAAHNGQPPSNT